MRRNRFLPSIASMALALTIPTFAQSSNIKSGYDYRIKPYNQIRDNNKPSKKRLKVKLARKQNLKNRK